MLFDEAKIAQLFFVFLLLISLISDIRKNTIPNKLVFIILLTGLFTQLYLQGVLGLNQSLLGIIAGFIIFMPFHLAGGMRGGDIKLMAACGAFLGFSTPVAAGLSLMVGSVLGFIVLYYRHGLAQYLSRYYGMVAKFLYSGSLVYQAPEVGDVAAGRFPYAVAIVTGSLLTLYFFS